MIALICIFLTIFFGGIVVYNEAKEQEWIGAGVASAVSIMLMLILADLFKI